jgi:hypothetical protein
MRVQQEKEDRCFRFGIRIYLHHAADVFRRLKKAAGREPRGFPFQHVMQVVTSAPPASPAA